MTKAEVFSKFSSAFAYLLSSYGQFFPSQRLSWLRFMFVHFSGFSLTSLTLILMLSISFPFYTQEKNRFWFKFLSLFFSVYVQWCTLLHTTIAYLIYTQVSTVLQNPQGKVRNKALCVLTDQGRSESERSRFLM